MNDDKLWWHFLCWKQFNKKVFKTTITQQDVKYKRFYQELVSVVHNDNRVEEREVYKTMFKFEKNGELYLLEEEDIGLLPLNAKEFVECYVKDADKTIHKYITHPVSAKINPIKTKTFREFINHFNPIDHTDEKTRIFLNIVAIASKHKPIKIQLCGPPSNGKTMNYNILQYITNDIKKVPKPTLAKLETTLYFNKVVLPDEMTSLGTAEVRAVEPTFLAIADESPELEKHSMAQNAAMNKIDLEETSIIFTYNRVEDLNTGKKFFTQIWQNPAAIRNRYPALLLDGVVTSKLPKMNVIRANKLVEDNWESMASWAKNALYFMQNIGNEMKVFERKDLNLKAGRQYPNFEGILDCLDAYSESQVEFDEWIDWINERIKAYDDMVLMLSDGPEADVVEEELE